MDQQTIEPQTVEQEAYKPVNRKSAILAVLIIAVLVSSFFYVLQISKGKSAATKAQTTNVAVTENSTETQARKLPRIPTADSNAQQ